MKTILIYLVSSILVMNSCKGNSVYTDNKTFAVKKTQGTAAKSISHNDTLLSNIQQKIQQAFVNAKISQSDNDLVVLEEALLNLNVNTKNDIVIYWYSYACYYHSILYMTENENKGSSKILDEGIKKLDDINPKNSEHLALLALMESFSIRYAAGMEVPFISKRVKQNAEKALLLDSLNLRAYYVLGSSDFYSPEQYGGGKKAEGYLLKAIRLNDQSVSSPYLPSWGKNTAYEMLIRLYINRNQFTEAKKYYSEAIAKFPDDYMINKLAGELINH
jgi:tetratricopeptide (TPR) repeat protein